MIYLELLAIILNVFRITSTGPECCASFVEMRNFAVVALKPTGSRSLNRHFETAKLGWCFNPHIQIEHVWNIDSRNGALNFLREIFFETKKLFLANFQN